RTPECRMGYRSPDLRYLVLPERPAGTERLGEAELAKLVTRDAMIGVALVKPPASAPRGAGDVDGTSPEPRDRRHGRRGGAAEKKRGARLRRGLAGPHLRHDRGPEPRSTLRVARFSGPAHRRDRARRARGRIHELLRTLAARLRTAARRQGFARRRRPRARQARLRKRPTRRRVLDKESVPWPSIPKPRK